MDLAYATSVANLADDPTLGALAALPFNFPGIGSAMTQNEIQRVNAERAGDVAGAIYCIGLTSITAEGSEMPRAVEQSLNALLPGLPHAAAYPVVFNAALSQRVSATRVLLQAESDPGLLTRAPLLGADSLAFNSTRNLFSDTSLGLGAYLGPLVLSRSPFVWADSRGRPCEQ